MQYIKPNPISLKNHPEFTERWVQKIIEEDTSILGLGELQVRDVERVQPKAGRLDMLLRDPDTSKRYELELMLGTVDDSHIIRTVEYWDIERKRYPQFDHTAVIVAENITSRFLNVISLFNSAIPLIALQMSAYEVAGNVILTFAKVLDEVLPGVEDEDEEEAEVTDRNYWLSRSNREMVGAADRCLEMLQEINPRFDFKYNKFYIGIVENDRPNNFVIFRPKKKFVSVAARVAALEEWRQRMEEAGLALLEGSKRDQRVVFRLAPNDLEENRELLMELFKASHSDFGE